MELKEVVRNIKARKEAMLMWVFSRAAGDTVLLMDDIPSVVRPNRQPYGKDVFYGQGKDVGEHWLNASPN